MKLSGGIFWDLRDLVDALLFNPFVGSCGTYFDPLMRTNYKVNGWSTVWIRVKIIEIEQEINKEKN